MLASIEVEASAGISHHSQANRSLIIYDASKLLLPSQLLRRLYICQAAMYRDSSQLKQIQTQNVQHLASRGQTYSPSIISPGTPVAGKAQEGRQAQQKGAITTSLIIAEHRKCNPFPCHMTSSTCATEGQHSLLYAGCITVKLCAAGLEAASFSGTPRGIPEQQLLSTLNSSQGSMPASLQRHDMLLTYDKIHADAKEWYS